MIPMQVFLRLLNCTGKAMIVNKFSVSLSLHFSQAVVTIKLRAEARVTIQEMIDFAF